MSEWRQFLKKDSRRDSKRLYPNNPYHEHLSKGGWGWRIEQRENTLWSRLWWEFCRGPTICVSPPWGDENFYAMYGILPSDIYFYYKPWLDENVGKLGWDWEWRRDIRRGVTISNGPPILIKVRKSKEHWASIIGLKWS